MDKARAVLPDATYVADMDEVAEGCDALIIATEWPQFKNLDLERARKCLAHPIIFDGRNLFDVQEMERQGFLYKSIGRARHDRRQPSHRGGGGAGIPRRKTLITQRPPASHLGGLWEFPGGKLEAGESFEQCLRRELAEELGIEVEVHELVEELTHEYPGRPVRLKFFRCRWLCTKPRAILCHDWAWIGPGQLPGYSFPPPTPACWKSSVRTGPACLGSTISW